MMLQGASWRGACYRVHVGGACSEGHVTGGMLHCYRGMLEGWQVV